MQHMCYLSNGLPLDHIIFTDDAVGHTDEVLAELDAILAMVVDISKWLCGDISSQ